MTPENAKKVLKITLTVAVVLEVALTIPAFVAPHWMLGQFKVGDTPDTFFLASMVGWMLLWVTVTCSLALVWVKRGRAAGWTLSLFLGAWWVLIGITLAWQFGRLEHLALDSAKGALICWAAWRSRAQAS